MTDKPIEAHPPGWCVHYRTPDFESINPTCEAGVLYASVWKLKGASIPFELRPCFLDGLESRPDAVHCPRLRRPTAEEAARHKDRSNKRVQHMFTVLIATADWREAHQGQSAQETITCPVCQGNLHLSISALNGHMSATCETPECVDFRE